ncbi:tetratricopeptide repeat protein [Limnospira sp. PMC 1042.18]|uniref:tetratricopeptide repeat protein n=1 Tax=Limnospira sp. PMC 1042.18 TaxID=2981018 RepID=UPI00061AF68A|nr:tetratricopeptide repeat protein [Limnospira sp. PMC 1042.18]MDT9198506.1 tetratricopeptide repeat protein [Limnospira sp. PMC 1042.18]
MDSNLAVVYLVLLLVFLSGSGFFIVRQIFRTREVESKMSQLQQQLSQGKGTAQEYYQLGCIYNDKNLYSQAIAVLQKALKAVEEEESPENIATIYNALGYAHFAKEEYDIAIRNYKEALKLTPEYATACNNLGYAYERKKLTSQALEAYEKSLSLEPNNQIAKRRAESLRKRLGIPTSETAQ